LHGRQCPFLEVSRKGARDCLCCRNTQNWAFRGVSKGDMEKSLQKEAEYQKYLVVVFLWEDKTNDPDTAVVRVATDIPEILTARVELEISTALESVLCLGVFTDEI
jgi:hypothetical protein